MDLSNFNDLFAGQKKENLLCLSFSHFALDHFKTNLSIVAVPLKNNSLINLRDFFSNLAEQQRLILLGDFRFVFSCFCN